MSDDKRGLNAGGMLLGALAGAVATFFLSPQSGEQNRKTASTALKKAQQNMSESGADIRSSVESFVSELRGSTSGAFEDADAYFQELQEKAEQTLAEMNEVDLDSLIKKVEKDMKKAGRELQFTAWKYKVKAQWYLAKARLENKLRN
ncbi:MAG: YtxH domain-containing protein [Pseudomonadales bacterium]|nr:YtxH domain-containing protein [Candidatus Woesebacteria bacterium]MCB9801838.1 YtxH domain-containing protein [Pseudomonadales bacterium]